MGFCSLNSKLRNNKFLLLKGDKDMKGGKKMCVLLLMCTSPFAIKVIWACINANLVKSYGTS